MKSLVAFLLVLFVIVNAKVQVIRYEKCDPNAHTKVEISAKFKEENGQQIVETGSMKTEVPLGNDIDVVIEGYLFENGKYDYLVTVNKDYCDVMHSNAGDFAYEMQKVAGIKPGTCPIPAGEYSIENHPLEFGKIKNSAVPDGQIKAVINLMEKQTNTSLNCMELEFVKETNN